MATLNSMRGVMILLSALMVTAPASAWGPDGHRIIAAIADAHLHDQTRTAVRQLLGNQSMADVANWADDVRSQPSYEWTKPLHYINVPRNATRVEMGRDCENGMCILGAIENFASQLRDEELPQRQRVEALMFIVHFVGDLHQPMHVAYRDDLGGNRIDVILYGQETNLHRVWDSGLILRRMNNGWQALAQELYREITPEYLRTWSRQTTPLAWANESLAITRQIYAELPRSMELGDEYYQRYISVALERLAMGGVRLAMLLNGMYAPELPVLPQLAAPEGQRPKQEEKPAAADATSYVSIVLEGECGGDGRVVHVVNSHESRVIEITLRRSWMDREREQHADTTVTVRAGDRRRVGCTRERGQRGMRDVSWEVLSATLR